jgi:hypothetical protein
MLCCDLISLFCFKQEERFVDDHSSAADTTSSSLANEDNHDTTLVQNSSTPSGPRSAVVIAGNTTSRTVSEQMTGTSSHHSSFSSLSPLPLLLRQSHPGTISPQKSSLSVISLSTSLTTLSRYAEECFFTLLPAHFAPPYVIHTR